MDRTAQLVRYALFAGTLTGLTLSYLEWHPVRPAVPEVAGIADVAERLARSNGWAIHADPCRPREVVFLVDPGQCHPPLSLAYLQTTAPEWEGIVRVEVLVTQAGAVDPEGGFVWRGLWFFGDQGMLDRMLPDLQ